MEHVDNVVHFTASANQAYQEAITLILAARGWAEGADLDFGDVSEDQSPEAIAEQVEQVYKRAEAEVHDRREKVAEMERSLLSNLVDLMTGPQAHDGPIRISRDGDGSFFWIHDGPANWVPGPGQTERDKPRYHGGLIFHKDHSLPADVRVGTWSIHT